MEQLPLLSSISELFSSSSGEKLSLKTDLNYFYRYCRVVAFLNSNDTKNILLKGDAGAGVGQLVTDRQGLNFIDSFILLSQEEA